MQEPLQLSQSTARRIREGAIGPCHAAHPNFECEAAVSETVTVVLPNQ